MVSVLHGRLPARKMLLHWFLCFFGNLAGSLFVMAIIMGCKLERVLLSGCCLADNMRRRRSLRRLSL